jgi:hypothetical protein
MTKHTIGIYKALKILETYVFIKEELKKVGNITLLR